MSFIEHDANDDCQYLGIRSGKYPFDEFVVKEQVESTCSTIRGVINKHSTNADIG